MHCLGTIDGGCIVLCVNISSEIVARQYIRKLLQVFTMNRPLLLKRKAVNKPVQAIAKPAKRPKVSKDAPATSAQPPPAKHLC